MELLTFKLFLENFQDGRNPQDKGDMARHGLKGKSITQLKAVRSSKTASPEQNSWHIGILICIKIGDRNEKRN